MKKARQLVIYSSLPPVGGHSTITLKIAEVFREDFEQILVLTRDLPDHGLCDVSIAKLRAQGVKVERIDKNGRIAWLLLLQQLLGLRSKGVDTFLCVGMRGLSPLMAKILKAKRSIFYHITHDGRDEEFQQLAKYSPSFDTMAVISPLSLEPLKSQPNLASDTVWIPQISELAGAATLARRVGTGEVNTGDVRSFGFLGRLSEAKGVALLLDIWRDNPPAANLHLMGEGALEPRVEEMVAETANRETGRIIYHGAFSAGERDIALSQFFSQIDCLCVPSIVVGEGLPTVILESLQCGIPVLTTPIGGTACFQLDWLKPEELGVITLDDPANFAQLISAQIASPIPRDSLSQACREYYEKWFSTSIVRKTWESVLLK